MQFKWPHLFNLVRFTARERSTGQINFSVVFRRLKATTTEEDPCIRSTCLIVEDKEKSSRESVGDLELNVTSNLEMGTSGGVEV